MAASFALLEADCVCMRSLFLWPMRMHWPLFCLKNIEMRDFTWKKDQFGDLKLDLY